MYTYHKGDRIIIQEGGPTALVDAESIQLLLFISLIWYQSPSYISEEKCILV